MFSPYGIPYYYIMSCTGMCNRFSSKTNHFQPIKADSFTSALLEYFCILEVVNLTMNSYVKSLLNHTATSNANINLLIRQIQFYLCFDHIKLYFLTSAFVIWIFVSTISQCNTIPRLFSSFFFSVWDQTELK